MCNFREKLILCTLMKQLVSQTNDVICACFTSSIENITSFKLQDGDPSLPPEKRNQARDTRTTLHASCVCVNCWQEHHDPLLSFLNCVPLPCFPRPLKCPLRWTWLRCWETRENVWNSSLRRWRSWLRGCLKLRGITRWGYLIVHKERCYLSLHCEFVF